MKAKPAAILLVCVALVVVWGIISGSLAAYAVAAAYAFIATGVMWLIQRALFGRKR